MHLTFYYNFSIIQLTYPSLFLLLLFLTFYWFLDQGFKHFYLFSFLVPGTVGALKPATSDDDQVFYHCATAVASIFFYFCKNQPCNLHPIFLIGYFHSFFCNSFCYLLFLTSRLLLSFNYYPAIPSFIVFTFLISYILLVSVGNAVNTFICSLLFCQQ